MLSDAHRRHLSDIPLPVPAQRELANIFTEDRYQRLPDPVAKAISA